LAFGLGWAVASGLGLCFIGRGRRLRRARRPSARCSECGSDRSSERRSEEARPRG
jgi:hypothetical protein